MFGVVCDELRNKRTVNSDNDGPRATPQPAFVSALPPKQLKP